MPTVTFGHSVRFFCRTLKANLTVCMSVFLLYFWWTHSIVLTPPLLQLHPRDGKRERIAGLVTGSVGLVAIGLGIYFGTQTLDAQNQLSRVVNSMGAWDSTAQSLYSSGRGDAIAATTLFVAGGVAVAGGAALYLWGWRRDVKGRNFAVAPVPGGAQASFACAF